MQNSQIVRQNGKRWRRAGEEKKVQSLEEEKEAGGSGPREGGHS